MKRLLDADHREVCTQTDFPVYHQDINGEEGSLLAEMEESLPFADGLGNPNYWDRAMANPDYRLWATDVSRPASPALQAIIDLSNVELAQEQDPNLRLIKDMMWNSPEWPSLEHVRAESAEVKDAWSQYANLKI